MRIYHKIFFTIIWLIPSFSWAQTINPISFDVDQYTFPFAGGINNPQFSNIDYDNDGNADLFVFDKACNCISIYQNVGTSNNLQYIPQPDWSPSFPSLTNWAALKDFNQDGIEDIFSYSDIPGIDGVIVYRGKRIGGELTFERINMHQTFNVIHYLQPSGSLTPLYVSKIDYPAIEDVDCDGDIDIVTFNSGGGLVEFYKNLAVERNLSLDTLIFERADRCWGGIYESGIDEVINLSSAPGDCYENAWDPNPIIPRHAGSTLMIVDANGDAVKDLFLGDISFSNLTMLTNSGDCDLTWFDDQEVFFPENDIPVDIDIFPVAFAMDLDNDTGLDLIVSSNDRLNSIDHQNIWWYKGDQANYLSNLALQSKTFLIDEMIDLGRSSSIVIEEVTGDSLKDIIMSNEENPADNSQSKLFLFENIGSQNHPKFKLTDEDYLGFSQYNFTSAFKPTFGDIDADGILDIVVGEQSGSLFFGKGYLNEYGALKVEQWEYPFANIDVGNYSQPFVFDYNKDGYGDLFVGEQNGNINYLENNKIDGLYFSNAVNQSPNSEYFAEIDTRFPGYFFGYSSPFLFENSEGIHLITGSESGVLQHFLKEPAQDNFFKIEDEMAQLDPGSRTRPFMADVNSNNLLELFVGNFRGGAHVYSTSFPFETTVAIEEYSNASLEVFPNPTKGVLYLENGPITLQHIEIIGYDTNGSIVFKKYGKWEDMNPLYFEEKGVYYIQFRVEGKTIQCKKVIVH